MKSSLKAFLSLALGASALVSTSTFAGNCGTGTHGDYYNLTAVEKGTTIKVSLTGFGANKLPNKLMTAVSQDMELKSDCTFTSVIRVTAPAIGLDNMPVFTLNGTWSYPGESKLIYFTLNGDISQGALATGTWGTLFDPDAATGIPQFFPFLINPVKNTSSGLVVVEKVSTPITVVYPSVSLQKGYMKLSKDNSQATITTLVGGKSIATPGEDGKGSVREANFSFGATTKATVSTVELP